MIEKLIEKLFSNQAAEIASTDLELYSVITRNMAEGICLVRASDGVVVYANPKFEQMFGYESGELGGKHVSILNYGTDQGSGQAVYDRILAQIAEQGEATYEVQNLKKDGTVFWCEATTTMFDHPTYGTVLVAVQQDITDRKQAVVALQESERRFRAIFNQTFQLMALLKPDGTVVEVNQTALDFGELSSAAVIDRPFWQTPWWASAATQAQLQAAIARAAQGVFVRYEVEIAGADGIIAPIDFSLKPIHDGEGSINLLIAEGRDITLRKNAEAKVYELNADLEKRIERRTAQLATSRQQYAILTEVSPVGVFRTDETGACIFVNDRWCEICGLTREQILRDGSIQALYADDYDRVRRDWKQAIDQSTPFQSEFRFCRADGTIVWVFCQAYPTPTQTSTSPATWARLPTSPNKKTMSKCCKTGRRNWVS